MKHRFPLFVIALLAAAVCLAGCEAPSKKEGQEQGAHQAPPPLVSVAEIKAEDVPWSQEFQATAAGFRSAEVRARVQGIIQKRLYKEGDFIKAGDLMFQLERDSYEAVYRQAAAALKNAEREWNRVRPLYAANAVSQKERDEALSSFETAKAAVWQAKINLDYCQVTAPVSGYTSKEEATEGNLVSVNSLLTTINQTDPMYVDFAVAAQDRMERRRLERQGRLRFPEGQIYKARLRLLDGTMYEGEGKVDFIDSQVQADTGVVRCRATFANPGGDVMPGQYVRIFMDGDVLPQALLIPQTAVAITDEGTFVMLVDERNVARRVKIEIGPAIKGRYLVLSGLKSGDRVVSDGMLKTRDGAPVAIAGPDGKAPAAGAQPNAKAQDADRKPDEKSSREPKKKSAAKDAKPVEDRSPDAGKEQKMPSTPKTGSRDEWIAMQKTAAAEADEASKETQDVSKEMLVASRETESDASKAIMNVEPERKKSLAKNGKVGSAKKQKGSAKTRKADSRKSQKKRRTSGRNAGGK